MTIGQPLGFGLFFPPDGKETPDWAKEGHDWLIIEAMPQRLKEELAAYHAAVRRGETENRERAGLPCLWLDLDTKRCRNYEHRPSVCRDFEVGEEACHKFRKDEGIGN